MRTTVAALVAPVAVLAVLAGPAAAQTYPERLITIVVPFTAGAAPDVLVRALAQQMATDAHVSVIVENRAGAGSILAAQVVAKAKPDGYTVLVTGNVAMTGNPHVFKKLPYDPVADFTPVTTLAKGPMYLYANPARVPANSPAELVQLLRKSPGQFSFAYTSITSRLPAELLQQSTGTKLVGVPYRSGNAALPDLISGQVDLLFTDFSAWPQVATGRLKAIGVTDAQRSAFAPKLPTFDEGGVKGMDIGFWLAAYLPAKAPPGVVARLQGLLAAAVKSPATKAAYLNGGTTEFITGPAELQAFQSREAAAWGRIIKAAGIEPE